MLTNKQESIGLKEFIEKVKAELMGDKDNTTPLFAVGKIELEIQFTVTRNVQGGVDFKVLQAGVDKTQTQVQTLKVQLEPILTLDEIRSSLSESEKLSARPKLTRG